MIKAEEFTKEELEAIIQKLTDFRDVHAHLDEQIRKYFQEFDKDNNDALDRKELRAFLNSFFSQYKIHFPVTDEYVDAVFREIDVNRDNKIQPNELEAYAMHFVNNLLPHYQTALETKQ